ncbi:MAG: helix-turn-helix domain-containing protein [Thermoplasmata archaeon]
MATLPRLTLTENQRDVLEKWSRGGSTPYRLVIRSQIVLLAAKGGSSRSIARRLHVNAITVARWRSRFLLLGIEGIRHDSPRLGSPPPVSEKIVRTILQKTLLERPNHAPRWSTRSLAREVGVSHSTVQRIWRAFDVRPPRSRLATLTRDLTFRPKLVDVVGVYVNPPHRAVAMSLREDDVHRPKGSSGKPHSRPLSTRAGEGSWVVDLIATLNLLERREPKGSAHRFLDREFLSFLHSVQGRRKRQEQIQLFAESTGSAPPVALTRWLHRHRQFSARVWVGNPSLQQIVAEWFGDASARRPTVEPLASLPGLRTAVERWTRDARDGPRPFAWTRK